MAKVFGQSICRLGLAIARSQCSRLTRSPCSGGVLSKPFVSTASLWQNDVGNEDVNVTGVVDLGGMDDVEDFNTGGLGNTEGGRRVGKKWRKKRPTRSLRYHQQEPEIDHNPVVCRLRIDIDRLRQLLYDIHAQDVMVIRLPPERQVAEYCVSMAGKSSRHCLALAEAVAKEFKPEFVAAGSTLKVEGNSEWYVIYLGNIVVHVFSPAERGRLELEKLWLLGPRHDDQSRIFYTEYESEVDPFV